MNGRWWILNEKARLTYVEALREGIAVLAVNLCVDSTDDNCYPNMQRRVFPISATTDEVAECVDAEYADPTMRVVSVADIVTEICKAKFEGVSPQMVERRRGVLRRYYSQAHQ